MSVPTKPQSNKPPAQTAHVAWAQDIGPIPDPATLERYNQIQPGFAERIMVMAEKEQASRHANDTALLANQHKQHKRDTDTFDCNGL